MRDLSALGKHGEADLFLYGIFSLAKQAASTLIAWGFSGE